MIAFLRTLWRRARLSGYRAGYRDGLADGLVETLHPAQAVTLIDEEIYMSGTLDEVIEALQGDVK
jgi:hypothetical protein